MLIFSDFHHFGLARSLFLTLEHRLGHSLFFPSGAFATWANQSIPGTWLTPNVRGDGGVPEQHLDQYGELKNVIGMEEFMTKPWDAVIISRPESIPLFHKLLADHPLGNKIKRIGQAGNEGCKFDWDYVPNFLSSDYLSYVRCPEHVNKIHYMQELGFQYQVSNFTPLTADNLVTINTFVNCLTSFNGFRWDKDQSWWGGMCPHCDNTGRVGPEVSVYGIWSALKDSLPSHKFLDYGINNTMGMWNEKRLPDAILGGSLTYGYKTYEGMGHSIAQSIALGRLCLVPRRFHRYRTANQFLIPNLTCLEAEWDTCSCLNVIKWFTGSLERANIYSEACFNAAKGIFNWEKEAFRVKELMDNLR